MEMASASFMVCLFLPPGGATAAPVSVSHHKEEISREVREKRPRMKLGAGVCKADYLVTAGGGREVAETLY